MTGLLLPVGSRRMSSYQNHIDRWEPSSEPGTDFYCPVGTPIIAPARGVIWGSGESIQPATGRWVGIDFDNGMGYRSMHHLQNIRNYGVVEAGEVYAISGASGYGEADWSWNVAETGGAHVHVTLWPTHSHQFGYKRKGVPYTIDFMDFVSGSLASTEYENLVLENDMRTLEVLSAPAWEAVGKRVVTNGTSTKEIPAGHGQMLINAGAKFTLFETNDDLIFTFSLISELDGLSDASLNAKIDELTRNIDLSVKA